MNAANESRPAANGAANESDGLSGELAALRVADPTDNSAGIDPALFVAGDFIVLRMALVDELGGDYEAAILLQRIMWRCERHNEWQATHAELAEETRLSARKVKRAIGVLRARGFLTSRRVAAWDPTQVWSVVLNTADRPSREDSPGHHVKNESAVTCGVETAVTSLQDVEDKDLTSSSSAVAADAEMLCTLLADLVEGNGSKRPTVGKTWLTAARLMLTKDGRDPAKAAELIRWTQADPFWRSNVLSMGTFREKYDRLRLKALEQWEQQHPGRSAPPRVAATERAFTEADQALETLKAMQNTAAALNGNTHQLQIGS